jgi:hypothetical protein
MHVLHCSEWDSILHYRQYVITSPIDIQSTAFWCKVCYGSKTRLELTLGSKHWWRATGQSDRHVYMKQSWHVIARSTLSIKCVQQQDSLLHNISLSSQPSFNFAHHQARCLPQSHRRRLVLLLEITKWKLLYSPVKHGANRRNFKTFPHTADSKLWPLLLVATKRIQCNVNTLWYIFVKHPWRKCNKFDQELRAPWRWRRIGAETCRSGNNILNIFVH